MNVYFDLSIIQDCVLRISDTTQEFREYLPEDSNEYITPGRFKYTDTYTVNVIKYVSTKSIDILNTIITSHLMDDGTPMFCDEACHTLSKDGHYLIDHLIIPSVQCIEKIPNLTQYERVYATDGINFYKYINGVLEECSVVEIIESNAENTTISKSSQDTFSLCIMNKKYLELSKKNLEMAMQTKCMSKSNLSDLNIDLIWMALNAIKYNIEFGMLQQAQALLEEVTHCTGVYNESNNLNKSHTHGCQCCL